MATPTRSIVVSLDPATLYDAAGRTTVDCFTDLLLALQRDPTPVHVSLQRDETPRQQQERRTR